jgi:hypothetical protein
MIKYALSCDDGHEFEGWFGDSSDFDHQRGSGLLECPLCASTHVRKQIMAPSVVGAKKRDAVRDEGGKRSMMMEVMGQVRAHVEANFDYVGDRFAAEARKIHARESEERGIYGEASSEEVRGLVEDGVPVAPLPPPAPRKTQVN